MTQQIYGEAYEKCRQGTARMLCARGAHRDLATEIAQDAWGRGWECISQLRDDGLLVPWVNSIARNLFLSRLRREARLLPLEACLDVTAPAPSLTVIDLHRVLDKYPPRRRQLLEAVDVEGYSPAETATRLQTTCGAVYTELSRARRAVREQLTANVA